VTLGRNQIITIFAVLLGLLVVYLANAYFTGIEAQQEKRAEKLELVQIMVATQPLAFGATLTPQNTKMVGFPASSVPEGAFRSTIGVTTGTVEGPRVALRPIAIGEPILASKISGQNGRATVSAVLTPGMRATAIRIDDVTGVAGFVTPGDTVDILLTRQVPGDGADRNDLITDVVMENVRVIGLDQTADENKSEPTVARTATVEVDLIGAQKLALASRVGTLSLALRNVANQEPAQAVTIAQEDLGNGSWRGRARYARPAPAPALAGLPAAWFQTPQPRTGAAPTAPAPAPKPRPSGPSVEIIRGTDSTTYEVKRHGY
jgi:pilus assembly protein CpaB